MSERNRDCDTTVPLTDEKGELRRQLEEAQQTLEESEHRYRELVRCAPAGIYTVDVRCQRFTSVNDAMCEMCGYSRDELLAMNPFDLLEGESQARFQTRIDQWLEGGEEPGRSVEYRVKTKEGRILDVLLSVTFTTDENGRPLGATVVGYDISERKRAQEALRDAQENLQAQAEQLRTANDRLQAKQQELEAANEDLRVQEDELREHAEALHESEERYRTLFETAPDAIVVCKDGRFLHANAAALRLIGACTFEELATHTVLDFFRPQECEQVVERMRLALAGQRLPIREATLLRLDGQEVVVEFHTGPIDFQGAPAIQTVIRDITERKRAEESLRENQALVHAVVDGSPNLIYVKDIHGRVLMANPPACEALGRPPEQVIGQTAGEFHRDDPEVGRAVMENDRRIMESGQTETIEELGSKGRTYLSTKAPYRDAAGNVIGLLGISHDITERRRAEDALRESEFHLARAQQMAHLGSWSWDIMGDRLYWSDETYRLFGLPPGELVAPHRDFLDVIHPEDRQRVEKAVQEALAHGPCDLDFRIVQRGGEERYVHCEAQTIFDAQGHPTKAEGALQDITERKRTEERLRRALQETQQRCAEVSALMTCTRAVLECRDLVSATRTVFDACRELLGAPAGYVAVLTPDGENNQVLFLEPGGLSCTVDPSLPMPVRGLRGEAYRTGHVVYENDFAHSPWAELLPPGHARLENALFAPVVIDGRAVGLLGLGNKPGGFTDHDATLAATFGELVAIALRNSRTLDSLRELNATLEAKVAQRTLELQRRAAQLQKLTLELTQAEERERRRVAVVLHEDLQQQIAGAKFHLNLLRHGTGDGARPEVVQKVDEMLRDAIEKSRRLSYDLSPAVLHMNDLAEVLLWLAKQVWARHGLTVHVHVVGEAILQSETLTMFLFRAAQEVLLNVVKHARINEATIRVRRMGRHVCLCISDTGRGFDPRELKDTAGFGLLAIRERVELLGGRMKIRSIQDRGTAVRIVVPEAPENDPV